MKHWDLALVDLALYRSHQPSMDNFVIVPNVRNFVESEPRQVVRVIVQGENPTAKVEVERVPIDDDEDRDGRSGMKNVSLTILEPAKLHRKFAIWRTNYVNLHPVSRNR